MTFDGFLRQRGIQFQQGSQPPQAVSCASPLSANENSPFGGPQAVHFALSAPLICKSKVTPTNPAELWGVSLEAPSGMRVPIYGWEVPKLPIPIKLYNPTFHNLTIAYLHNSFPMITHCQLYKHSTCHNTFDSLEVRSKIKAEWAHLSRH